MITSLLADGLPPPVTAVRLLTEWRLHPAVVVPIVLAGVLYAEGLRSIRTGPAFPRDRVWAFYGGLFATLVALCSPLDAYSDVSFSIHMLQHILLIFVAAPLFALGTPVTLALRAVSPGVRRRFLLPVLRSRPVEALTHPITAFVLFTVVLYATHLTGFYNLALRSQPVHDLEHVLYLGTAVLFWWPVVGLDPAPHKLSYPARILYVVAQMPAQAFLSMILLSGHPYAFYVALPRPWGGAAARGDLGNGAAYMWTLGGLVSLIAVLLAAGAWFRHSEARQRRIEAEEDRAAAAAAAQSVAGLPDGLGPSAFGPPSA